MSYSQQQKKNFEDDLDDKIDKTTCIINCLMLRDEKHNKNDNSFVSNCQSKACRNCT